MERMFYFDENVATVAEREVTLLDHTYDTDYAWRWLGKLLTNQYRGTLARLGTAFNSVKVTTTRNGTYIIFTRTGTINEKEVAFYNFTPTADCINDLRQTLKKNELHWKKSKY